MNPDDGYYGYTQGQLEVVTGWDGTVGVQLEQTQTHGPVIRDQRDLQYHAVALYRRFWSILRIAKYLGYRYDVIRQALLLAKEPLRSKQFRRATCVDCGRPSAGLKRCGYHKKIQENEKHVQWRERKAEPGQ